MTGQPYCVSQQSLAQQQQAIQLQAMPHQSAVALLAMLQPPYGVQFQVMLSSQLQCSCCPAHGRASSLNTCAGHATQAMLHRSFVMQSRDMLSSYLYCSCCQWHSLLTQCSCSGLLRLSACACAHACDHAALFEPAHERQVLRCCRRQLLP